MEMLGRGSSPETAVEFFMFQESQVCSLVSRAPFFNWRGRGRPIGIHLRFRSGFSGWREGRAGGCGQ